MPCVVAVALALFEIEPFSRLNSLVCFREPSCALTLCVRWMAICQTCCFAFENRYVPDLLPCVDSHYDNALLLQ